MADTTVKIDDKSVIDLLNKLASKGKNLRPAFTVIAGQLKVDITMNFRRQGSHGDIFTKGISKTLTKWKPLSSLTKFNRPKGGKILQNTGMLMASIGTVRNITNNSLEYGTNYAFSTTQHFGAIIKPKRAKKLAIPLGHSKRVSDFGIENLLFTDKMIYLKSDMTPLFVRKDSVTIPARPFMTPSPKGIKNIQETLAAFLMKGL